jgi:hypothetical protein
MALLAMTTPSALSSRRCWLVLGCVPFRTTFIRSWSRRQNCSFLNLKRPALMLKGEPMPDRYPDQAAMHYLIAEGTRQLEGKAAARLSHRSLSDLELELGAKVQRALQQGVELGILDDDGRLQTERLVARGVLDPEGNVIKDIFGRSVPCQP